MTLPPSLPVIANKKNPGQRLRDGQQMVATRVCHRETSVHTVWETTTWVAVAGYILHFRSWDYGDRW